VRSALRDHRESYPVESLGELDAKSREERAVVEGMDAANAAPPSARYEVLAATYGDEGAAMAKLQQLIDAGHDGTLRSEDKTGTVLYEIYVGPFDDAEAAEDKAAAIAEPFGLSPKVMLLRSAP
jgi:hypothetical protein